MKATIRHHFLMLLACLTPISFFAEGGTVLNIQADIFGKVYNAYSDPTTNQYVVNIKLSGIRTDEETSSSLGRVELPNTISVYLGIPSGGRLIEYVRGFRGDRISVELLKKIYVAQNVDIPLLDSPVHFLATVQLRRTSPTSSWSVFSAQDVISSEIKPDGYCETIPFDLDGDGYVTPFTDGLLLLNNLQGRRAREIAKHLSPEARANAIQVGSRINSIKDKLDLDGVGGTQAFSDASLFFYVLLKLGDKHLDESIPSEIRTTETRNRVRAKMASGVKPVVVNFSSCK